MSLWTMTDDDAGKPKYLSDALRNAQTVSDKDATIGINAAEALDAGSAAKGLRTPGWVTYTTYTDANGNVRHKSEVLVAAGSMGSDGTETLVDDLSTGTPFAADFSSPTDIPQWIVSNSYIRFEGAFNGSGTDPIPSATYTWLQGLTATDQLNIKFTDASSVVTTSVVEVTGTTSSDNTRVDVQITLVSGDALPASPQYSYVGGSLEVDDPTI